MINYSRLTLYSLAAVFLALADVSASWSEAKDDYDYRSSRLRFGNLPHDQTVLLVSELPPLLKLPNLSFHREVDEPAFLKIKEGNKLYLNGNLTCILDVWGSLSAHRYSSSHFAEMNLDEYNRRKEGKINTPVKLCPASDIIFGAAGVRHSRINETSSYDIVFDEFNGEWGKVNNVFDDGSPLYVRIPKEERHHFRLNISRHQATELARAHFPKFDETIKAFSNCLKDENSVNRQSTTLFQAISTFFIPRNS